MIDFRNRPKDSYIHEADWQALYVLTEHWKSELLFYNDDLKFLHHLIGNYFMRISKKDSLDMVREIGVGLLEMENESSILLEKVNKHLQHLAELIENPIANDSQTFRAEHEKLEDDFSNFVKAFRKDRKEVFTITEYIIDGEEIAPRLNLISE